MIRIESIVAATDFSGDARHAARRAALLAHELRARLKLIHVLSAPPLQELRLRLKPSVDVEIGLLHEARRSLHSLADEIAPVAGAPIERQVIEGVVLDEISNAASSADLLVIGARGQHPVRDLFLGSTAERLLMRSTRPMLVVKREPETAYRRVLVPVDFSEHSRAALQFAQQVAPTADIHVFHAYESLYEGKLQFAGVSQEIIDRYVADSEREAYVNMNALLGSCPDSGLRTFAAIDHGDARALIPAKASEFGTDLIVVGKHGRSLLAEYFLGGVTRATLARAECDVAIVPERQPTAA